MTAVVQPLTEHIQPRLSSPARDLRGDEPPALVARLGEVLSSGGAMSWRNDPRCSASRERGASGHCRVLTLRSRPPGEVLEPGDEAELVELASGRRVLVLSLEDMLLWRLREWIHWRAASGFQQAAQSRGRATVPGMGKRDLSYSAWQLRRRSSASRRARLNAALPPFRRRRLRAAAEARFLRRIGAPEPLIGPVGTDEQLARERAELIDFARRLRRAAIRK
jgi:hypothetical protein